VYAVILCLPCDMEYEVTEMECDVSQMDSWNSLPGPLILCGNATRIENIRETISTVRSNLKEGQHTNLKSVVGDIGTTNRQVQHPITTQTGGSSRVDSHCGAPQVGSKKCNCDVRLFASSKKHSHKATETTLGESHAVSPPYVSREEMYEAHWPLPRKRACRLPDQDKNPRLCPFRRE